MQSRRIPYVMAVLVVVTQVVGLSTVWSADSQRGVGAQGFNRVVVSGVRGEVSVTPADTQELIPIHFHDPINHSDQLTIGTGSHVEILMGKRAVVTAYEDSELRFLTELPERTAVQLMKGKLQVAVARGDHPVAVHTPTATAVTYGGLLRISVTPDTRRATPAPFNNGVRLIQMHTVTSMVQELMPTERFEAFEGNVRVQPSAPESVSFTVESGRSVQIIAGQIRQSVVGPSTPASADALPATDAHALTAPRGIQHLVAQEKRLAEALQTALLGDSEIPGRPVVKQAELSNVILSTSFGIPLATTAQGNPQAPAGFSSGTPAVPSAAPSASAPPVAPPVVAPPPPVITLPPLLPPGLIGFDDDGGRGRGRGRGHDDDIDERLFQGLVGVPGRR